MTFDLDEALKNLLARQFYYFDPYLTYSDPNNQQFIETDGQPSGALCSDGRALFQIGKEAFKRLMQDKESSRERFNERHKGYCEFLDQIAATLSDLNSKDPNVLSEADEQVSVDFKECDDAQLLTVYWQKYLNHSQKAPPDEHVKSLCYELFLFLTLHKIDDAFVVLELGGGVGYSAIEATKALSNAIAIESEDKQLAQARSQFAHKAVMEKLKQDPKQGEKNFVKECWQQWQINPESYKSKAAFARDMLDKCEHLKSTKKIEDWCRQWESER